MRAGGSFSPASASRSAGVSMMLNPTEPDEYARDQRRRIAQAESTKAMALLPPLSTHNTSFQPAGDASTSTSTLGTRPPRRILTPRLPPRSPSSLHRAVSLNQLPSTATTHPHASFLASPRTRSYAIDSGAAGASALPTPTGVARQSYGIPAPTSSNRPTARRASVGASRGMRPLSESTSPKSSYSGYSQAEQASPAQYGSSLMPTLSAAYTATSSTSRQGTDSTPTPVGSERQNQIGVPMSSTSGQNVYQMMTLETTSGTVQLPVDVQAASRVADEKRRRNAGASARFRQRRKEKEKEASTAISRLEQQLKDLSEDSDFYKRERDYFAGVVLQVPGGDRHFPRPQSPRHRRTSTMGGASGAGVTYMSAQEQDPQSPGEGRNVRRRTSTNPLPRGHTPLAGPVPPSYGSHTYGQQSLQHSGPLPSPAAAADVAPAGLMHAAPQTGPWNPYSNPRHPSASHGHSTR